MRDPGNGFLREIKRFSETDLGRGLIFGTGLWLLLSGRLWWLFESVFILMAMLAVGGFVGAIVFRNWLSKQRVINSCPVCGNTVELAPAASLLTQCPQCRSILRFDPEVLAFVVEESTRSASPNDPFGGPFGGNYQQMYDPKNTIIEVEAEEVKDK
eukprot:tig00001086_g6857.t1